ncbi:hypothetical protein J18TS1_04530 [Oceanobacillus oncorhynchi subsp. incaldanensis]|nr:hypothetical protein J18TS1_04530 [Oceanobacillus oncorhynchi subsp. incaldanensis]
MPLFYQIIYMNHVQGEINLPLRFLLWKNDPRLMKFILITFINQGNLYFTIINRRYFQKINLS